MRVAQLSHYRVTRRVGVLFAGLVFISSFAAAEQIKTTLRGESEVPPVTTSASAEATINIGPNRSVTGSIKTSAIAGTSAHIHIGMPGKNGPVIVTFTKLSDDVWTVPAGVTLTDAQFEAYKAGELYVNVHSAAHANGEIRGQLKPGS